LPTVCFLCLLVMCPNDNITCAAAEAFRFILTAFALTKIKRFSNHSETFVNDFTNYSSGLN
jgi:hypothetical protein